MTTQENEIIYSNGMIERSSYPVTSMVSQYQSQNSKTPEECKISNLKQSTNNARRLLLNNFTLEDFSVVLTFSNNALEMLRERITIPLEIKGISAQEKYKRNQLPEEALREAKKFLRRLSRAQKGGDLRYFMVVSNRKIITYGISHPVRIHVHIIMGSSMLRTYRRQLLFGTVPLKTMWEHGHIRFENLYHPSSGSKDFSELAYYWVNQSAFQDKKNRKKYISGNIHMPEKRRLRSKSLGSNIDLERYTLVDVHRNPYNPQLSRRLYKPKE